MSKTKTMLSIKEAKGYLNNALFAMAGVPLEIEEWEVLEWIESGELPAEKWNGRYYIDCGYLNEIIGEIHLGLVEDLLKEDLNDDN